MIYDEKPEDSKAVRAATDHGTIGLLALGLDHGELLRVRRALPGHAQTHAAGRHVLCNALRGL